jgi:hypothetical protein
MIKPAPGTPGHATAQQPTLLRCQYPWKATQALVSACIEQVQARRCSTRRATAMMHQHHQHQQSLALQQQAEMIAKQVGGLAMVVQSKPTVAGHTMHGWAADGTSLRWQHWLQQR